MKILHITETAMGGVGTYLNQLVPLQSATFGQSAVRLVMPVEHAGQTGAIPSPQAIYFSRPVRSVAVLLRLAIVILRAVKDFQPDIIHAHSTFAGALVRIIFGWRHNRPVLVYCPHGWAFNIQAAGWKLFAVAVAERLLAPFCDRIIAISNHEAREAIRIGIDPAQIESIRNAIPVEAPVPVAVSWRDSRRKILFVGRLDRQKGFDILAEAVAGLEADVVVRVAGAAVTTATSASAAPHIEFLGWLSPPEIEGHLRCSDVVVMPSRWEGFGLTALEAMRAGKPVIASAVGGLPEVVASGVTGRLVPPGDPAALRHVLLSVEPGTLQRMGEQGKSRFRREFTIDLMHQSLMDLYITLSQPRLRAGWRVA